MKEYDEMAHFEKLLDEFKEDARAADYEDGIPPSASARTQYNLTRRNILAFVEELVSDNNKKRDAKENALREERNLLQLYLHDVVGDMTPAELDKASEMDDMDYCAVIIAKSKESYD